MVTATREVERKYEAADGSGALPDLRLAAGVADVTEEPARDLDAVYYDTPDLRLAAAGLTLRRRTGGPDEGWHLKLPLPDGSREEIQLPLDDSDTVPETLRALTRSRTRDHGLVPVVRLHTHRDVRTLRGGDGTALAEVASDRVTARVIDPAVPEVPALPTEWTEVEVELAPDGPPELLESVEVCLAEAGLHRSSSTSKLAHALRGRLTTQVVRPRTTPRKRDDRPTAADTLLPYVAEQIRALVELDPAARRELPDAVHRMRVAARRLRSILRAGRRLLDPAVTTPIAAELGWLGGELGYDRDREVLVERLEQRLAELPAPLVTGPVGPRLHAWAAGHHAESRRQLLDALDSPRHLALLDSLDALLAEPPLLPQAHKPAEKVFRRALRTELRRVGTRLEPAFAAPPGHDRDTALHEARKAAKRARYVAEAAVPAVGRRAARYRDRMRDLQELLGDHQDSSLARATLREIADQAHAAGENAFTFGVLHGAEAQRAAADERRVPELWARAVRAAR